MEVKELRARIVANPSLKREPTKARMEAAALYGAIAALAFTGQETMAKELAALSGVKITGEYDAEKHQLVRHARKA